MGRGGRVCDIYARRRKENKLASRGLRHPDQNPDQQPAKLPSIEIKKRRSIELGKSRLN